MLAALASSIAMGMLVQAFNLEAPGTIMRFPLQVCSGKRSAAGMTTQHVYLVV